MTRITVDEFNAIMAKELPWALEVGMTADCINDSVAVLRLPFDKRMLRPGGTVSGPTMMALANTTMYAVMLSAIGVVKLAVTMHSDGHNAPVAHATGTYSIPLDAA